MNKTLIAVLVATSLPACGAWARAQSPEETKADSGLRFRETGGPGSPRASGAVYAGGAQEGPRRGALKTIDGGLNVQWDWLEEVPAAKAGGAPGGPRRGALKTVEGGLNTQWDWLEEVPAAKPEKPGFWSRVGADWKRRMRDGSHGTTDIEKAAQVGGMAGALVGGVAGAVGGAAACAPTVAGAIGCGAAGATGGIAVGGTAGAAVGAAVATGVKYIGAVAHVAISDD